MTFDEVRTCLEKDGWPVDPLSNATLRSRFRSGDRVFPLFVHVEEATRGDDRDVGYATFAVIPYGQLPDGPRGDALAEQLLVLNREMNLAKFSVDEDGDVVLSVEYPLADLDPSEVRDVMDVLSFYAEQYRAVVPVPSRDAI